MGEIRRYLFSVICMVVICGLIEKMFVGTERSIIKFITGLMVTLAAITPILRGELLVDMNWDSIPIAQRWAVSDGEDAAQNTLRAYIKEGTETYILGKARDLGADILVDVELDSAALPTPTAVTVNGAISPYAKRQLMDCITRDLGIDEDQQRWIS